MPPSAADSAGLAADHVRRATTGMVGGHFFALADRDHVAPLATRCETMTKPPRRATPPNWSRKLARVIVLDDGRQLRTLDDARAVIIEVYGSANVRFGVLNDVIRLLLTAAKKGKRDDRRPTASCARCVTGACCDGTASAHVRGSAQRPRPQSAPVGTAIVTSTTPISAQPRPPLAVSRAIYANNSCATWPTRSPANRSTLQPPCIAPSSRALEAQRDHFDQRRLPATPHKRWSRHVD